MLQVVLQFRHVCTPLSCANLHRRFCLKPQSFVAVGGMKAFLKVHFKKVPSTKKYVPTYILTNLELNCYQHFCILVTLWKAGACLRCITPLSVRQHVYGNIKLEMTSRRMNVSKLEAMLRGMHQCFERRLILVEEHFQQPCSPTQLQCFGFKAGQN